MPPLLGGEEWGRRRGESLPSDGFPEHPSLLSAGFICVPCRHCLGRVLRAQERVPCRRGRRRGESTLGGYVMETPMPCVPVHVLGGALRRGDAGAAAPPRPQPAAAGAGARGVVSGDDTEAASPPSTAMQAGGVAGSQSRRAVRCLGLFVVPRRSKNCPRPRLRACMAGGTSEGIDSSL